LLSVSVTPGTKFQVRNSGAFALIGEKSSRSDRAAFSIVNSVAISPPEHPGELGPTASEGERESARKRLEKRLEDVLTVGTVIDVVPGK
jgi:hypothetical protein